MLHTRLGLERDNVADRDGAAALTAVRMGALGGDSVNNEFAALVIVIADLRRETFTVVEREDADRAGVGFVQPVLSRKFGD